MARKIIAIGGEPATGKTTLMRQILSAYEHEPYSWGKLIKGHYIKALDLIVLGTYTSELFSGTDRLSMAVQPEAEKFVLETTSNILFEGDRLFTISFLSHINENVDASFSIYILEASNDALNDRHLNRGDDQDEKFLRSRRTKVNNVANNFLLNEKVTILNNDNPDHIDANAELIKCDIMRSWEEKS